MLLQDLRFPKSTFNRAIAPIMAQLAGMADLKGQRVFATARQGLYRPRQEHKPQPADVPACYLWCDSEGAVSDSIPLIFDVKNAMLQIYMLWYDFGDDVNGVAEQRIDFVDYVLRNIQGPVSETTDATGIVPNPNVWGWPSGGFTASIDHTNAYRHITHQEPLVPPWYSTRVDIPLELQGLSDTFGEEEG